MRAAVLDAGGLEIREWPAPSAGPGEALVALTRVGICGSDCHFVLDGTATTAYRPIVLGHEPSGRVAALGPGADGPAVGTRVAIVPLVTCGECERCRAGRTVLCRERECLGADRDGAWADLVAVPARNLIPIPEGLSDELAAVATDAVATAYHAVRRRGGVGASSRVAVWGAGGLGLAAVGIARALGAGRVVAVDPRPEARAFALETGAEEALDPDEAPARILAAGGVDVAIDFVGHEAATKGALRSLDAGGRVVVVGISDGAAAAGRLVRFVMTESEMVGSYGSEPEEVGEVLRLLATGELVLPRAIGDVIPLSAVANGLARVAAGDTGGARIVLDIAA